MKRWKFVIIQFKKKTMEYQREYSYRTKEMTLVQFKTFLKKEIAKLKMMLDGDEDLLWYVKSKGFK